MMTKKKISLTRKTIRTTITSCIVLAFVALFIGLSVFVSNTIDQYVDRSFQIARNTQKALARSEDCVVLSKEMMATYRSFSKEGREADDYLNEFYIKEASTLSGRSYQTIFETLQSYMIGVDDVYLGMFDGENDLLVYFIDPDGEVELRLKPGEWEEVTSKECDKFLNWNGEGMLYDISNTDKYGWMCTAGYPIKDGRETVAFVLVDVMLDSVFAAMKNYIFRVSLSMIIVAAFIAWLVTLRMRKMVAEPIDEIARAASSYVEDHKEGIEKSHFKDLKTGGGYEIENLAQAMAEMEEELTRHEKDLTRITAEKERINTELNMARRIQKSVLPSTFPPYPDRNEFEIYASMEAAREIGGDFYDFYFIDDDHLCLVMADVSGKGVPAALFMMNAKMVLQSCASAGLSAAKILENANDTICGNNRMEMFVTVWVGVLELSTGKLKAANAGHEYPAVMKKGRFELFKDKHGFVIGGMEDVTYEEYELTLEPGDKIFVYTDGITEASDEFNKMFGTERMIKALNIDPKASPEQIIDNLKTAIDLFVDSAEQFDDMTMLCLEYKGK